MVSAQGLTILVKGVEVPRGSGPSHVAVDLVSADGPAHGTQSRSDPAIPQLFARRALRHAFHNLQQAAHPIRSAPLPRYRLARYACEILSLRAVWNSVELQTHLSWWRATAAGRRLHARQLQRRQATALVALAVASLVRQNLVRAAQSARAGHERRALAAWFASLARSHSLVQAGAAVRERRRWGAIAAGLAAVGAEAANALIAVRCAGARHALRALRGHAARRHEWRGALARSAALRVRRAAQGALRVWAALLPVALLWRCAVRCAAEARRGAMRAALLRLRAHGAAAASARRAERCAAQERRQAAHHALYRLEAHAQACATAAALRAAVATDRARGAVGAWRGASAATARLLTCAAAVRRLRRHRATRHWALAARAAAAAAVRASEVDAALVLGALARLRRVWRRLGGGSGGAGAAATTAWRRRLRAALAQWHALAGARPSAPCVNQRARARALALWRRQHARHAWFALVEAAAVGVGRRRQLHALRDACLSATTRRRWLAEQRDERCARGAPLRARLVCCHAMARWAARHERAWMAAAAATRGALKALAASLLLWRSWAARFSLARLRWRRLGDAVSGRWRQALHERQATLGRLSAATRSWRSDADERWRRSYNCFAVEAVAVAKHDYVPLTFSSKPTGTPTALTRTVKHPAAEPGPGGGPPTWLLTAESVLEATTPPASPALDADRRRLVSPRLFPTSPAERASHDGKENMPGARRRGEPESRRT